MREKEYWPNGKVKSETVRSEDPADFEVLKGHPNFYPGNSEAVKDDMLGTDRQGEIIKKERVTILVMPDRSEDTHDTDPFFYFFNAENGEDSEKLVCERTLQYDEEGRLAASSVRVCDEDLHTITAITAEYDPETGERTQTTVTEAEWNEENRELLETKTEYDKNFIPVKEFYVTTKDAEPVTDPEDKELSRIDGIKGTERSFIVGPNENLMERYKQMMEMCDETGIYPEYTDLPVMSSKREYAIEISGDSFCLIRKNDIFSPIKGDKVVEVGDEEKDFEDLSPDADPLPLREEAQVALVEKNPMFIFNIKDPSAEAQLLAAKADPEVLEWQRDYDDPSEKYPSPVTDREVLLEVLRTDPSASVFMGQQTEDLEDDREFIDAVEQAKEETCERLCRKDSMLIATDTKLFIYSEKGAEELPGDITKDELNRGLRTGGFGDVGAYIVSPSEDGRTFDICGFHTKRYLAVSVSADEVMDVIKGDIKNMTLDDAAALEDVRKVLKERSEPVKEQNKENIQI